jgi:hypothetical protein
MPTQNFHQRGFAYAIWTQNGAALPTRKCGGQVFKNPLVAEAFADIRECDLVHDSLEINKRLVIFKSPESEFVLFFAKNKTNRPFATVQAFGFFQSDHVIF